MTTIAVPSAAWTPLAAEGEGEGFHAPTLGEFFPGDLFSVGGFGVSRIMLVQALMTGLLCLFFVVAFRAPRLVPRGLQNLGEMAVDLVRVQIVDEVMGAKGRRFLPYFAALFFFILALNIAGIIPLVNIAGTSIVAVPLLLALLTWVIFNVVGIRTHGLGPYLKGNLFPPGVPKPIYVLLTPIEAVSTFVLRPFTLTIRLLANMMAGHFMLVLFFVGASYLLFEASAALKVFGLFSFAMGLAFTLFEILVALLQAYIFTLLTAVYIDGAMSEHH